MKNIRVYSGGYYGDGYKLVGLHVQRFDAAWSRETELYIGPGGMEDSGLAWRYNEFKKWLAEHNHMTVSRVSVIDDGQVGFTDGRHRFAVLRDYGLRIIPAVMDPESIENAQRYGYIRCIYRGYKWRIRLPEVVCHWAPCFCAECEPWL
jgi:hypothetical protein